jgi:hypothetical protein
MCQQRTRASRDLPARYRYPHLPQCPTIYTKKTVCQNSIMGQSYLWASQNIFAGHYLFGFSKYGHILGKTLCSGPRSRPGRHAHGGTGLAPRHHVRCPWDFLGLVNTSRTSLVQNNERYLAFSPAVTRASLEDTRIAVQFLVNHL